MNIKELGVIILGYISVMVAFTYGIDRHDNEVRLQSELFKNYSQEVMPPHGDKSVTVIMGITLMSISNVDQRSQTVTTELWLSLEWNDDRLKWDKNMYKGIADIRIPPTSIWQPDIRIYNSAKHPVMDHTSSNVNVVLYSTGRIVWIAPGTLVSHCTFNLKYYPYDKHECSYKFGSWTHNGFDIDIQLRNNETEIDLSMMMKEGGEWEIVNSRKVKNTIYYSCCPVPYVDVNFYLTLQRRSPFYQVAILCPLLAAIFLILISFWISPVAYERIFLNLTASLAVLLILLHLNNQLPAVGNSPPLIMSCCAFLLLLSVVLMAIHVLFITFIKPRQHQVVPHWVTIVLQSWVAKALCSSPLLTLEPSSNEEDPEVLVENDESKSFSMPHVKRQYLWISFFQIIDRISFIVIFIVIFCVVMVTLTN